MLWVKTFHIFFVVAWFAGLFYLPRIFVNLAIIFSNKNIHQDNKRDEYDRLIVMGRKLYKFIHPIMILSIIFGVWLWIGYEIGFEKNLIGCTLNYQSLFYWLLTIYIVEKFFVILQISNVKIRMYGFVYLMKFLYFYFFLQFI